jgi:hypothetical protein
MLEKELKKFPMDMDFFEVDVDACVGLSVLPCCKW